MFTLRSRSVRALAAGVAAALVLTACAGTHDGDSGSPEGTVTLRVNYWGDFGLDELVPRYTAAHPHIRIQLNAGDYSQQHEDLQKFLVAGSGAPDIAAIDESQAVQFRNQASKFVNLLDKGAGAYEDDYLPWNWQLLRSPEGRQVGLGTDVGGQAICYRTDLFEAAGLPTDREKVSALWPTWEAFLAAGKRYEQGSGGKKFVDGAGLFLEMVIRQQPVGYFGPDEKLAMDGGPRVGWELATALVAEGLSANLQPFTPEWNAAMKNGGFAALTCPAWMQGYIQGQAPNTKGRWDIAYPPGGGGNLGGSFWSIPAQGRHTDEAYRFVEWLIQPEQQIAIFKKVGNLPSQPALYDDPAIRDFRNPFFNDAPVGRIFPDTARKVTPQYQGRLTDQVRTAVSNVLDQVQQGKINGPAAWEKARSEAERAAR
ncbi:ABC transporter substrate-binding protein [Micromonospora psammae]|uniref:ABC transporter substrate-binding protein n=1 Tax=Micromonospora sp. CPCC 205556 TaxID=3122398 RepID=UPI002FF11A0A